MTTITENVRRAMLSEICDGSSIIHGVCDLLLQIDDRLEVRAEDLQHILRPVCIHFEKLLNLVEEGEDFLRSGFMLPRTVLPRQDASDEADGFEGRSE